MDGQPQRSVNHLTSIVFAPPVCERVAMESLPVSLSLFGEWGCLCVSDSGLIVWVISVIVIPQLGWISFCDVFFKTWKNAQH